MSNVLSDQGKGEWTIESYNPPSTIGPVSGNLILESNSIRIVQQDGCCVFIPLGNCAFVTNKSVKVVKSPLSDQTK